MNEEASSNDAESMQSEPPQRPRLVDRTRLARWIALAGVLGVVLVTKSLVLPKIPEDHEVELKVPSPAEVTGLDLTWIAPETGEDILTTSLHFASGTAPGSVRTTVHLPDGPYEVAIAVERTSGVDSTRRRITLDSSARVTIPLP